MRQFEPIAFTYDGEHHRKIPQHEWMTARQNQDDLLHGVLFLNYVGTPKDGAWLGFAPMNMTIYAPIKDLEIYIGNMQVNTYE